MAHNIPATLYGAFSFLVIRSKARLARRKYCCCACGECLAIALKKMPVCRFLSSKRQPAETDTTEMKT